MHKNAIIFGVLHILLGGGMYGALWAAEGTRPSATALIPAFVGAALLLLGVIGMKESLRKHAMHAAAALALLAFLAAVGRGAMKFSSASPYAVGALIGMALLSGVFLILCIKSFKKARAAAKAS